MSISKGCIKAISFDYGHVLGGLDLDALLQRLHNASSVHSIPIRPSARVLLEQTQVAAYQQYDDAIAQGHSHQQAWYALMKQFMIAALCVQESSLAIEPIVDELWKAQPTQNLWRYVPKEAFELLETLHHAHIPMVVTSNSEGHIVELLTQIGIRKYFRAVIDSGVEHVAKPDVRIFQIAAHHLEHPLHEIVHIGDSEQADVLGARNAGAWSIRFDAFVPARNQHPSQAHAIANNYTELSSILFEACKQF